MKKIFYLSVAFNVILILFFAGKRYYYSYGAGAGNEIPRQRQTFQDIWNQMRSSEYQRLKIDTSDIVFIGNSLTEAFPVTEIFGPHVKNRGISGNKTTHIIKRIGIISSGHPKRLFIEIGINDLNAGCSVDSTFDNYRQIISLVKTGSPKTRIFIQALLPTTGEYAHLLPSINQLNNKLKSYCKEQSLCYIDLYTPMLKNNELNNGYTADGLHLNDKGYAIWNDRIKDYVK